MKRLLILIFVLLIIPATFFAGAAWSFHRARSQAQYELNAQTEELKKLQGKIYGPNRFHMLEYSPETKALIESYDPVTMGGCIKVSYIGGFRDVRETYLELQGSGDLYSSVDGNRKLVTTIDPTRCRDIFRRTLTGGILNYSDDVIQLKQDLIRGGGRSVTCSGDTLVEITVEKLGVSKVIDVYVPKIEHENHPHIIEYKLMVDLEDEIYGLVPAGFPLWK